MVDELLNKEVNSVDKDLLLFFIVGDFSLILDFENESDVRDDD